METVKVEVSGIIHAASSAVWRNVCLTRFCSSVIQFPPIEAAAKCGLDYRNIPLRKLHHLGEGRLCEELTILDHENHEMRYKLVSDPNNKNPFPASFLGYRCSIRLHNITTEKATFMRIFCAFKTEKEAAGMMKATWERIHLELLQNVKEQSLAPSTAELEQVHRPMSGLSDILVGPVSRVTSLNSTPSPLNLPLDPAQTIFRLGSVPAAMPGYPGPLLSHHGSLPSSCLSPRRSSLAQGAPVVLDLPAGLPPESLGSQCPLGLKGRAMSVSPTTCNPTSDECWSQKVYLKAFKERVLNSSPFSLGTPHHQPLVSQQQWLSGQMQTSTSL
eukprot:jgi/Botrbrau1/10611/Bobra.154_1s0002.1